MTTTLTPENKNFVFYITNDLKIMPKKLKITIIFLGLLLLWNTFFDFNHLINPTLYPSWWTIINSQKLAPYQQILFALNGIAAFSNIIAITLIAYGRISNYFWGLITVSTYGAFALAWGYVGDMQLNLFYFLPFQIIGYQLWKKHLVQDQVQIQKFKLTTFIICLYAIIILSICFYFEIPAFSQALLGSYQFAGNDFAHVFPHSLDAVITALSIVGQILMTLRFREQWILWIIINVLHIIMFAGIANNRIDINILIMTTVAFGNSLFGFYQWYFKQDSVNNPSDNNPAASKLCLACQKTSIIAKG